ncbi:hypothetical protein AB1N83_012612 [Pleurotus pulmonarius]
MNRAERPSRPPSTLAVDDQRDVPCINPSLDLSLSELAKSIKMHAAARCLSVVPRYCFFRAFIFCLRNPQVLAAASQSHKIMSFPMPNKDEELYDQEVRVNALTSQHCFTEISELLIKASDGIRFDRVVNCLFPYSSHSRRRQSQLEPEMHLARL